MRKYRTREAGFKRSWRRADTSKRPIPGSDDILKIGAKCKGGKYSLAIKTLASKDRTRKCAFCGRRRAKYKCRGTCGMHLCVDIPQKQDCGKTFPVNGPHCFSRFHGTNKYSNN